MNKQTAINEIIENFDFDRVHKVMRFLNWTWRSDSESPTMGKLVLEAMSMLSKVYDEALKNKEDSYMACGGFHYSACLNEDKTEVDILMLKFVLSEWEYYEEED